LNLIVILDSIAMIVETELMKIKVKLGVITNVVRINIWFTTQTDPNVSDD